MHKAGKDHSLVKLLPPGVYQYKFIVDGQWRHDPNQPCVYDDQGNINNVLEVQEYIAEDLSGLATFEPPPSPTSSYQNPTPSSDDFMKEPPSVPPQLQLSLLNVPTNSLGVNASAANNLDTAGGSRSTPMDSLPRPQHVILNHLYSQRTTGSGVMVIGSTTRYKSKYVTTVLYRARSKGDEDRDGSRSNMLHRIVREGRGDGDASAMETMDEDVTSTAMAM
jgi:5'-AMP-activated protein kinase regulatory beta subunit